MKKFAKKIVILAVCLLFAAGLTMNCLAANGITTTQSEKVSSNSSFTLNINLEYSSSTPIVIVMLNVSFPTEYLAVVGHTNGTLFSEASQYLSSTGEYGIYFSTTTSAVLDGKLATINFTTSKDFTGSSYVPITISARIVVDGDTKELSAFHMVNYSAIAEDDIVIDEDDIEVDDGDIEVDDDDIEIDEDDDVVVDDDDEDIVIDEDGDVEITVTKATQATTTAKTTAKTTTATTTKITTPATTTTTETTTEPTTEATTEVTTEATTEAVQTTLTLPTPAPETEADDDSDATKKASGGGVIAAAIVIIIISVCAVLGIEYYKAIFIK